MVTINGHEMAREVAHCQLSDLAEAKEGAEIAAEFIEACDDYFGHFCKPIREGEEGKEHQVCPKCGEMLNGFMAMMGLGVGLEWGLVHGEARCTGCRWPYRVYHFIRAKDAKQGDEPLLTVHNLGLAYHPDEVTVRSTKDKIADALNGRG